MFTSLHGVNAPESRTYSIPVTYPSNLGIGLLAAAVIPAFVLLAPIPASAEPPMMNFAAGYQALSVPSSLFMERLAESASRLSPQTSTETAIARQETRQAALELAARFAGISEASASEAPAQPEPSEVATDAAPGLLGVTRRIGEQEATEAAPAPARVANFPVKPMGLGAPLPEELPETKSNKAVISVTSAKPDEITAKNAKPRTAVAKKRETKIPLKADARPERVIKKAEAKQDPLPWRKKNRFHDPVSNYFVPMLDNCADLRPDCAAGQAMCGC